MGRLRLLCPTRCNTDERGLGQTSGEGQGGGACCDRARVGTSGHEWARAGMSGHEWATGQQQQPQELTVMHTALLGTLEWTTGADWRNGCMSTYD